MLIPIRYLKNEEVQIPEKAHETDTGYDLVATSDPNIKFNDWGDVEYIEYKTSLRIILPPGWGLDIRPRSSISKYNLVLANSLATIDQSYLNEILLRYKYIWSLSDLKVRKPSHSSELIICGNVNKKKIYKKGDKIGQAVPHRVVDIDWIGASEEDFDAAERESSRKMGGFGSSGK